MIGMTSQSATATDPAVTLRFAPLAEHVRAARLVAVAVARRSGVSEEDLDEVRLAVGELCARAVRRSGEAAADAAHDAAAADAAVTLELVDGEGVLVAVVTDRAGHVLLDDEDVSLALVRGLADSVEVTDGPGGPGGTVTLRWDWR